MTPHAVLESIHEAKRAGIGDERHIRVWNYMEIVLARAVHFSLGDACPTIEHESFGFELFKKGMFQLPFDVTFWTGKVLPDMAVIAIPIGEYVDRQLIEVLYHSVRPRDIAMTTIGPVKSPNNKIWYLPTLTAHFGYNGTPVQAKLGAWIKWDKYYGSFEIDGTSRELTSQEYIELLSELFVVILGANVLMMTDDVKQRVEPAPDKLNRAREKRGKPAIGERRIIVVRPHAIEALSSHAAHAAAVDRNGPRPHMRRGHFRTLNRLTEHERVIPVAPSVVGISDEARELIKAKTYRVE